MPYALSQRDRPTDSCWGSHVEILMQTLLIAMDGRSSAACSPCHRPQRGAFRRVPTRITCAGSLPIPSCLVLMPIVSDDEPDGALLAALVPFVHEAFDAEVSVADAVMLPAETYNATRQQYSSSVLLRTLVTRKNAAWARLLGIADVDLYTPDLNFVFGEADGRHGVALFSLARLRTPDRNRFVHRAATEAIHELGHTYGLNHCRDPQCVMWFSNTLAETDRKGTRFCPAHIRTLRQRMSMTRDRSH
jgi:archaemetzincin